jgi:DNA-binding XRE family transcriptional regulator
MKKPRTKKTTLEIRGQIPNWMLSRLKKEYKNNLIIKDDKEENKDDFINAFETEWFTSIEAQMTPGENLKIYRENAGLSQMELGQKLGNVPRQNISLMEKNKRGISKEMAKKLSKALKAPISRFI